MSSNINDLLSKSLDFHFYEIDNVVNLIVNNNALVIEIQETNKIQDKTATSKQLIQKIKSTQKIENFLVSITSIQDSCIDAGLYSLEGNIYHTSKLNLALQNDIRKEYRSMPWFVNAITMDGKRSFLSPHIQMQTIGGVNVISMTKLLKNQSQDNLGVILIDYDLKIFRNIYDLITLNPNDNIYITDDKGNIVYEKNEKLIGEKLSDSLYIPVYTKSQKQFSTSHEKDNYFVTVSTQKMSGWKFITVISNKNLLKNFNSVQTLFILVMAISFLFFSIVYYFIVISVFNPIKKLAGKMNLAAKGNLTTRFETNRSDEIGTIGKSFNYMLLNISLLMNEKIKTEQKLRHSEIRALQSQINPHFIYNSLNAVKWLAIEIKADKIKNMVEALVSLLKNTIYKEENLITLEKEFQNLENFVHILNVRYDDRYKLIYEPQDWFKQYYILKMLLQPIVENALFHGFSDETQNDCKINICCNLIDDKIHIKISDNGKGIDKALLNRITNSQEYNRSNFTGIGVSNVDERIQLNYGNDYGINIQSSPNIGTTVYYILPALKNTEEN